MTPERRARCRRAAGGRGLLGALVSALALAAAPDPAAAWSGHALLTWQALAPLPEVAQARVRAEPLEAFLAAEAPRLAAVLDAQEQWARAQVPAYAPRPDGLAFRADAGLTPAALRTRFLRALRLNPTSRLPLFLQLRPGAAEPANLPWDRVTTLASGAGARENVFRRVEPGEDLSALDVLASASAEPDYGLDLGLWEDNHAEASGDYRFGRQPFGNPAVDYSSQAPFHMGFFHEARIVYAAAGFLKRSYPEARIAQFDALARHAFATGHPYWGWRFAGWAMHYVQDLTQPYHARVLPGVSVVRMLGVNALDIAGLPGPKTRAVQLVTNRHTMIENYLFRRMVKSCEKGDAADTMLAALRDAAGDAAHRVHRPEDVRAVVAAEAAEAADALDAQLERCFPAQYVSDPSQELGQTSDRLDMHAVSLQAPPAEQDALARQSAELMRHAGRHSRALVRAVLGLR